MQAGLALNRAAVAEADIQLLVNLSQPLSPGIPSLPHPHTPSACTPGAQTLDLDLVHAAN